MLYFTSHSLSADGRSLVVINDRDGDVNLHVIDTRDGTRRPLTDNREGILRSYVYFDGQANTGLGKASVSFDTARGVVYYLQGLQIRAVTLDGQQRDIARVDENQVTAFTHISNCGRYLCLPTTDARALEGPCQGLKLAHDIDRRVREESLSSLLNVFDTQTGERILYERVPRAWITHVQFSPTDPKQILYNHEWAPDSGRRRIWLFDGRSHRALRSLTDNRRADDWVCHEVWTTDGNAVIYHGGFKSGPAFVGRLTLDGECVEIPLPDGFTGYGHFTASPNGDLVSDGYFRFDDDPAKSSRYIASIKVDWPRASLQWNPLCLHDSSWKTQDAHPHPVFDHEGKSVLFTSDKTGKRVVYRIAV